MRNLCRLTIAVAIAALFGVSAAGVDQEKRDESLGAAKEVLHPYFVRASNVVWPAQGESRILLGRFVLPQRFTVAVKVAERDIEAAPIEFVLIGEGSVMLDGVELAVREPFYIATTEISNEQWACLDRNPWRYREYEDWASDRLRRARLEGRYDPEITPSSLVALEEHLGSRLEPAMGFSYERVSGVLVELRDTFEMHVRLPRLGEWVRAMRGGGDESYWWGENLEDMPGGQVPIARADETGLSAVRNVSDGLPNPYGLRNVIWNAAELVMMADENIDAVRQEGWPLPRDVGFMVGGSAITGGGWPGDPEDLDWWAPGVHRLIATWQGLHNAGMYKRELMLGRDPYWLLGVRPVIEIPAQ